LHITKGQFRVRQHQKILLEYFSDWCQHLTVANDIKLLANKTGRHHKQSCQTLECMEDFSCGEDSNSQATAKHTKYQTKADDAIIFF
jgi:hypothetical protein